MKMPKASMKPLPGPSPAAPTAPSPDVPSPTLAGGPPHHPNVRPKLRTRKLSTAGKSAFGTVPGDNQAFGPTSAGPSPQGAFTGADGGPNPLGVG